MKKVDVVEFARRVERLCDFLLEKISDTSEMHESDDLRVIQDIKTDAADLQFEGVNLDVIGGLEKFMKGQ